VSVQYSCIGFVGDSLLMNDNFAGCTGRSKDCLSKQRRPKKSKSKHGQDFLLSPQLNARYTMSIAFWTIELKAGKVITGTCANLPNPGEGCDWWLCRLGHGA